MRIDEVEIYKIKDNLYKSFARHRLDFLSGYKTIVYSNIPILPLKEMEFPNGNGDTWILEEDSDTQIVVLYTIVPNGQFPTHIHMCNDEEITILTEDSDIECVTEKYINHYTYLDSFKVNRGVEHAIVNHSNFPVTLRVKWTPRPDGFNAIFL